MTRTIVKRTIAAPPERVFRAVSDVRKLPEVVPCVVRVELLGDESSGVGMRFRETRLMNGKEAQADLEVTEFVDGERLRFVTDSHGTVWDSVFTLKPVGDRTELDLTMDARAHKLLPRILNPIMKPLVKKGLDKHMDAVKEYCERPVTSRE